MQAGHQILRYLPWRQAILQQQLVSGQINLEHLHRLGFPLWSGSIDVTVRGILKDRQQQLGWLDWCFSGIVGLICQRCEQPLDYELKHQVKLLPVSDVNTESPWPEVETVWLNDDAINLDLWEVIGQELMLFLPMIPRHATQEKDGKTCSIRTI